MLERIMAGPAPAPIAPPKPTIKPVRPNRPAVPVRRPDPWRRREWKPGQEPAPAKAATTGLGDHMSRTI